LGVRNPSILIDTVLFRVQSHPLQLFFFCCRRGPFTIKVLPFRLKHFWSLVLKSVQCLKEFPAHLGFSIIEILYKLLKLVDRV